jgi:hypothetical protein
MPAESVSLGNALASAPQAITSLFMKLFGSPVVDAVGSLVGRSVGLTRLMTEPAIHCREINKSVRIQLQGCECSHVY